LRRRAREISAIARDAGLTPHCIRLVRRRRTSAHAEPGSAATVVHSVLRTLDARLHHNGRSLHVRTTDLEPASLRVRFAEARERMLQEAPELFAASGGALLAAPPVGPFDGLKLFDPELAPADSGTLRGLAMALSSPTGARVSAVATAEAEAVVRADGAGVAWQHTELQVALRGQGVEVGASARLRSMLPPARALVDRFAACAERVAAPAPAERTASTTLLLHPVAGAPLLEALARMPLRTARLNARLSLQLDPWVVGGLASRPCDAFGQASRPLTLMEGGLQRKRLVGPLPGNLRVGLGGKSLERLCGETEEGVLVEDWHRVVVDPQNGRMRLDGFGWSVRNGQRTGMLPRIGVEGRLPALFSTLTAVGADPWSFGAVRSPTLVFDRVRVTT